MQIALSKTEAFALWVHCDSMGTANWHHMRQASHIIEDADGYEDVDIDPHKIEIVIDQALDRLCDKNFESDEVKFYMDDELVEMITGAEV